MMKFATTSERSPVKARRSLNSVGALGGTAAALLLVGSLSSTAFAVTLNEAVQIAIESHPTVMAAEAAKRASEKAVDEARAPFFPTVDGRFAYGYERTNSPGTRGRASRIVAPDALGRNEASQPFSSLNMPHMDSNLFIRQMVFDGFETSNREQAAMIRTAVAEFQVRDSEESISLRTTQAYLSVLRSDEIVALAEENVQAHVEVLDDVTLRAQQGGGSVADVRQAEARLALARTRLTELRGDARDARTDFAEAVGIAAADLEVPEPPESAMLGSVDSAVDAAYANNPAIRAASTTVDARRTDVEASKGVFWPRLDIELSASRNQNIQGSRGLEQNYQAFAVARWNFYNGGADLARKRRLMELASQAIQLEVETKRLVEEQMRVDHNALMVAQERIPTLEDRVTAADQVVVAYRQQFQLGQRTLLDVLDVENELFQAQVALVTGEYDLRAATYQALTTIGTLSAALGVVPPSSK